MSPCVLPQFDFYDSSIANFFWTPDPVKCEPWDSLMFIDSEGILRYNTSAINNTRYRAATRGRHFVAEYRELETCK
jgi:hypothetical protein